ncbi:uncharacterized protein LOC129829317 [Salvelinus fontinalis]|uniref:uncharacterized protein LOC129829317 n=1 Tax=Salvelinus fontinalis TaxID=8038 RepID=UPI002484FB82|nr:uncharacterized protein LOC129829317 [Salvelinus fontinalis]
MRFCVVIKKENYLDQQPAKMVLGLGSAKQISRQPGHTIYLLPTLVLAILMSCDLNYYIKGTSIKGSLKPGKEAMLHAADTSQNMELVYIPLYDVNKRLFCLTSTSSQGALKILISAPYWLFNKTVCRDLVGWVEQDHRQPTSEQTRVHSLPGNHQRRASGGRESWIGSWLRVLRVRKPRCCKGPQGPGPASPSPKPTDRSSSSTSLTASTLSWYMAGSTDNQGLQRENQTRRGHRRLASRQAKHLSSPALMIIQCHRHGPLPRTVGSPSPWPTSTDDAIAITLHTALSHLDKSKTYVRMLFIDYSSAFNTIVPSKLIIKLEALGLNPALCK